MSRDEDATTPHGMSLVIHGIGTMVYGERDYWPDGSFITTEWFVLAWVPVIPLCSKRISYTPDNPYSTLDARGGFYVYQTLGVDRRQAFFVYLWFFCLIAPLVIWSQYQEALARLAGDADWAAGVCLAFTAVAFVFPYFLRRWVKRRNAEKWKRQALGLHG